MKKHFILILLLTLISKAHAQSTDFAKKTNIPGTRVYLEVPEGFKISKAMTGIEKNETVGIAVMDLIGGNYYTNAATFTKSNWESRGATVISFKEHHVGEFPAKTVHIETIDNEGYALVFGDTTFSAMVMGMLAPGDSESLKQIETCLQSISYNKTLKIDPLEFAKFELNTQNSTYKFAKSSASMFIYSVDGIVKDSYDDDPMFMVNQMPYDAAQMTAKSIAQEMLLSQKQRGLTYDKLEEESTESIKAYSSYETHLKGTLNGREVLMYLSVVAKGENSFVCIGLAKGDYENQLKEFKNLGRSIKLKY
ncbi:hypothetical protein NO995_00975 [Aestuariibaculum sp. M13]|uniref:hypothetical protein n=1 Tax=Aestuariibaculum sp. M13 TaxID=2967132 RepID=UPI002159D4CD|nr:hypothetical protein [Aestuariibaculum sp. M13]MCR8666243.1 hypothetical protein [Aestuariibaculum sp. M13]